MPILTFVSRLSDGMLLVASMESASEVSHNLNTYKQQSKQLLKKLTSRSPTKCSIEAEGYCYHYVIASDIVYLTLSEKSYPKRLAYLYLSEIHLGFEKELQDEFGPRWSHQVNTVARPYAFIKFDKFIQKVRKEYANPSSNSNMSKVNENLSEIQNIMRLNIQEVLKRGEALENVSNMSSSLADRSKEFKWGAKKLSLQVKIR